MKISLTATRLHASDYAQRNDRSWFPKLSRLRERIRTAILTADGEAFAAGFTNITLQSLQTPVGPGRKDKQQKLLVCSARTADSDGLQGIAMGKFGRRKEVESGGN